MRTGHIIGKHPSILTYPDGIWPVSESYGLNHAAYLFNTKYAFSGHGVMAPLYEENGYIGKTVWTNPLFGGNKSPDPTNTIGQFIHPDAVACKPFEDQEIRGYIRSAMAGNDILYPQWSTILHLAIFFLIKKGFDTIHLHGCNLTPEAMPGHSYNKNIDYARGITSQIIRIAKPEICIHWNKSFKDYENTLNSKN